MTNTHLIPMATRIIGNHSQKAVYARTLHTFLQSKQEFANWIKSRIRQYGFVENQDFIVFDKNVKNPKGGRPAVNYYLSLDMAKELAMVERNDKGRQARRYFIECERRLLDGNKHLPVPVTNQAEALVEEIRRIAHDQDRCKYVEGHINKNLKIIAEALDTINTVFRANTDLPGAYLQLRDARQNLVDISHYLYSTHKK